MAPRPRFQPASPRHYHIIPSHVVREEIRKRAREREQRIEQRQMRRPGRRRVIEICEREGWWIFSLSSGFIKNIRQDGAPRNFEESFLLLEMVQCSVLN